MLASCAGRIKGHWRPDHEFGCAGRRGTVGSFVRRAVMEVKVGDKKALDPGEFCYLGTYSQLYAAVTMMQ